MTPSEGVRRWWKLDAGGVLVCALLTVVIYITMVRPTYQEQSKARKQGQTLTNKQREAEQSDETMGKLRAHNLLLNEVMAEGSLQLESGQQVNHRLARLTQRATRSGLQVDEIVPGKPEPGTIHATIPIRLSGSGSYRTCADFLHRLHNLFSDTAVASFDMSANSRNAQSQAEFTFDLVWFTVPDGSITK